ncbi:hypothetical protein BZA02_101240 [Ruegeria sp. P4]|nr:hypothetical protein BZA02_101240 [Ruegeria sp. P4]
MRVLSKLRPAPTRFKYGSDRSGQAHWIDVPTRQYPSKFNIVADQDGRMATPTGRGILPTA